MPGLASRPARLLAPFLIAALVLAACSPAGDLATPAPAATIAAAPTGDPAGTTNPVATQDPGPTGDAVTGGEPGATATIEPAASPTATPTPVAEANPTPTPLPDAAAADPDPFAMNLYRKGDFVAQYTFEWCVGASLQMAVNMTTGQQRTSRADQQELWEMARDRSFSPFGGANPRGWTASLNDLGIGPYELVSLPSFEEALTVAAEALRATRRPVGLVMWRGRHAWVMSGFEATADPRRFDEFEVTGIRVLDPLYPHGSSVWGPSAKPNSLVSPATLAKQYVLRDSTRVNLGVPPGYLLILPVAR
jgi:hypothetical protein